MIVVIFVKARRWPHRLSDSLKQELVNKLDSVSVVED